MSTPNNFNMLPGNAQVTPPMFGMPIMPAFPLHVIHGSQLAFSTMSRQEIAMFRSLWHASEPLRLQGKIIYYVPRTVGLRLTMYGLKAIANNIREMADTNAFVHFDGRYQAFRIGQVIDDHDKNNTSRCMLCYAALMPVIPGPEDTTQVLVKAPVAAPVADLSLPQSKANRAARPRVKKSLRKIPKPANSWIIYRRDKHAAAKAANSAMKTADISKVISAMWKAESPEVLAHYAQLAQAKKDEHQILYPDYKCEPRKSSEIKRRKNKSKISLVSASTPEQWQLAEANMVSDASASSFSGSPMPECAMEGSNTLAVSNAFDLVATATDFVADNNFAADTLGDFNFNIAADAGTFLSEGEFNTASFDFDAGAADEMADYMNFSMEDSDFDAEQYSALFRNPDDLPEVPESSWALF